MVTKHFALNLECRINLALYPLDHQICTIEIVKKKDDINAELMPISLNFDGGSVNQYITTDWKFKHNNENKIIIEIEFFRQRIYFVMSVILPTILINVVGF